MIGLGERILAARYAAALLAIHEQPFSEDECVALCKTIDYYRANPLILIYLSMPLFTEEQKKAALQFVRDRHALPVVVAKIDTLLFEDARIFLLPTVYGELVRQSHARAGRILCTITAATHLSAPEKQVCTQFLTSVSGKKPLVTWSIDPSLIAGVRLQTENWLWEDSLDARLKTLANTLLM